MTTEHDDTTLPYLAEMTGQDSGAAARITDLETRLAAAEARAAEAEDLHAALKDIVESWDWWRVDEYDRCITVPEDAIDEARKMLGLPGNTQPQPTTNEGASDDD